MRQGAAFWFRNVVPPGQARWRPQALILQQALTKKGRMMTESVAKPKTKGPSRASKPRESASKSPPKAGAKAKPGAEAKRAAGKAASSPTPHTRWAEAMLAARGMAIAMHFALTFLEERKTLQRQRT